MNEYYITYTRGVELLDYRDLDAEDMYAALEQAKQYALERNMQDVRVSVHRAEKMGTLIYAKI